MNHISSIIIIIFIAAAVIGLIYWILCDIRCNITYRNQLKVFIAIYDYNLDCENACDRIDYNTAMETFDETYKRFWDCSCKRIVDSNTYEKIKPYLEVIKIL